MEPFKFKATEEFFSAETQSTYLPGLTYTARSPELADLVSRWVGEGLVERADADAKIAGQGEVS